VLVFSGLLFFSVSWHFFRVFFVCDPSICTHSLYPPFLTLGELQARDWLWYSLICDPRGGIELRLEHKSLPWSGFEPRTSHLAVHHATVSIERWTRTLLKHNSFVIVVLCDGVDSELVVQPHSSQVSSQKWIFYEDRIQTEEDFEMVVSVSDTRHQSPVKVQPNSSANTGQQWSFDLKFVLKLSYTSFKLLMEHWRSLIITTMQLINIIAQQVIVFLSFPVLIIILYYIVFEHLYSTT